MIESLSHRPEWSLLVALATGLLIGAERERRKEEGEGHAPAGVRTFALVALLGAVTAQLGEGMALLTGALVGVGAIVGYSLEDRRDPGLTGEIALVLTFALGVLSHVNAILTFAIGVVVTALLAYRTQIHQLVRKTLTQQELLDGVTFAIAAAVILPLLPNRALDPMGLFNPFTLWRLVVLVMALSSLGHIAQRMIGARYGLMIAGLFAGFISATAAIAAMAHRSRADPDLTAASAAGAAASLLSSMIYMMILIFVVSPRLLSALTAPLGAAALTLLGYSVVLGARSSIQGDHANAPGRAFNFGAALLFVGLVATVTVLCRLLAARLGSAGALIGAAATGLTDAHAAALSMATLDQSGQIDTPTAVIGVLVGLTTNMAIKIPVAFALGSRRFAVRIAVGGVLAVASLWAAHGLSS